MLPLPFAQVRRPRRAERAASATSSPIASRSRRRSGARYAGIRGLALHRSPAVALFGLAALAGLADGKESGANQSQDQGCPSSDHPAHQALVPPGEFVQERRPSGGRARIGSWFSQCLRSAARSAADLQRRRGPSRALLATIVSTSPRRSGLIEPSRGGILLPDQPGEVSASGRFSSWIRQAVSRQLEENHPVPRTRRSVGSMAAGSALTCSGLGVVGCADVAGRSLGQAGHREKVGRCGAPRRSRSTFGCPVSSTSDVGRLQVAVDDP